MVKWRPDGVRPPAHGRVQRREQRIVDQQARACQSIQQTGLPGVGVPGEHDRRFIGSAPTGRLALPHPIEVAQLPSQPGHLGPDASPVDLDLGLTRSTPDADPADLLAQRLTPAAQPRQHVLHLREGHLGLALFAARMLGKDVEDQPGPVDDLDAYDRLEFAQLARSELAVADQGVRAGRPHDVSQFLGLARSHVRGRVRHGATLGDALEDDRPRRLREACQLRQGSVGVLHAAVRPHPDEHDALQADLAVLDLSDVLELRGQSRNTSKRIAIGELFLDADITHKNIPDRLSDNVPSATRTAGPVSTREPDDVRVTVRLPPGTSTRTSASPSIPAAARTRSATAQIPVPQLSVSPTPRSCTRMRTWRPGSITDTNSTF